MTGWAIQFAKGVVVVGMLLATNRMSPAEAAVLGSRFLCTVSPGWTGQTSMVLRMWVTPGRLHVIEPMLTGPIEAYYTLLADSDVGLVAASGAAEVLPGNGHVVSGSVFYIMRATGLVRWVEAGADKLPIEDRSGTCSADLPG